jgi:hypothetical protein
VRRCSRTARRRSCQGPCVPTTSQWSRLVRFRMAPSRSACRCGRTCTQQREAAASVQPGSREGRILCSPLRGSGRAGFDPTSASGRWLIAGRRACSRTADISQTATTNFTRLPVVKWLITHARMVPHTHLLCVAWQDRGVQDIEQHAKAGQTVSLALLHAAAPRASALWHSEEMSAHARSMLALLDRVCDSTCGMVDAHLQHCLSCVPHCWR